jgi:hypothetical protein
MGPIVRLVPAPGHSALWPGHKFADALVETPPVTTKGPPRPTMAAGSSLKETAMDIEFWRSFLLACTLVNYGLLLFWFAIFWLAHDWLFRLHGRWFRLSAERFDAVHYGAMAVFKLGVVLFNLTPFIALHLLGRGAQ